MPNITFTIKKLSLSCLVPFPYTNLWNKNIFFPFKTRTHFILHVTSKIIFPYCRKENKSKFFYGKKTNKLHHFPVMAEIDQCCILKLNNNQSVIIYI